MIEDLKLLGSVGKGVDDDSSSSQLHVMDLRESSFPLLIVQYKLLNF